MRIVLALLLYLLSIPCMAGAVRVDRLPYEYINTFLSNPGETLHAFLLRVGPELRAYSDQTTFEACAAIAAVNAPRNAYGVVIGTNRSHMGCVIAVKRVPEGMSWTGETIHSHGKSGRAFYMNKSDKILAGLDGNSGLIPIAGQDINHFSAIDLQGPGGYLATGGGVIYVAKGSENEISLH